MNSETIPCLHFNQLVTKRSETPNEQGLKKLCFVSTEHQNELLIFLWLNRTNDTEKFQFFFFEKVLEWSKPSGLTTNITNRLESTEIQEKRGVL
jgi:hypothetical protein